MNYVNFLKCTQITVSGIRIKERSVGKPNEPEAACECRRNWFFCNAKLLWHEIGVMISDMKKAKYVGVHLVSSKKLQLLETCLRIFAFSHILSCFNTFYSVTNVVSLLKF
jgi:hypothetical protein